MTVDPGSASLQVLSVKNAPTAFGPVAYEIVSDADHGRITATVEMPSRRPAETVWLRLRHPRSAPIRRVMINGRPWSDFEPAKEVIGLAGLTGALRVEAEYDR